MSPNTLRTESGLLLQLMAHRPITIDGAGADGSTEGAGGAEPGSSNDHGGCGACIDQVVVLTAPPRPSARNRDAVNHRVVHERRPSNLPQIPTLGLQTFCGVREGGPSHHRRLHNIYVRGIYAR